MRLPFLGALLIICSHSIFCADFSRSLNHPETGTYSEKLYVNPEDVLLSKDGIYLITRDAGIIPIQTVQSDSSGIFVTFNRDEKKYGSYTCPGCGREYQWWENCTTPGCPKNRPG